MTDISNILDTKGLTSSEANHITNITKELVKDLDVTNLALTSAVVLSDGKELALDENTKRDNWVADIQKVGKLYSLSAWLKSAIKYKENLLTTISYEDFKGSVEVPELEYIIPTPDTSFEAYLHVISIKERNEYLSNEAVAAHIGKFVHSFDDIREKSERFSPTSVQRFGAETLFVKSERLYTKQELLDGFFTLQREHREAEQVVNLYKSRHKTWEKDIQDEVSSQNQAINDRNHLKRRDQLNAISAERAKFEVEKREEKQRVSALKIVIPNDLQPILDEVLEYAKK